jgi:hypothetical protein
MWATPSGEVLRAPRDLQRSLVLEPARWRIRSLLRKNSGGMWRETLEATFSELAANAMRGGSRVSRRTGKRYDIFECNIGGQRYLLLTSPLHDGTLVIQAVRRRRQALIPERENGDRPPPRGSHPRTKRGMGPGRRGVHEEADARRRREQAAAETRAAAARRQARRRRAQGLAAGEGRAARLTQEVDALKNQLRHAQLHGEYDEAARLQAALHTKLEELRDAIRAEHELGYAPG